MRRVCIHQPDFAPYLGFFERLLDTDVFIVLDDAQYTRGGWHNRDRIKTPDGPKWLTLPVSNDRLGTPINGILLSTARERWVERHLRAIAENYRKAACFERVFPGIERLYATAHDRLVDFNMAVLRWALEWFDLRVPVLFASELAVPGSRTGRLVDLVRHVGGTHYLSGTGARSYLEPELFAKAGIGLEIRAFEPSAYPQLHGAFVPNLSCLDLFLNCGPAARDVLRRSRP